MAKKKKYKPLPNFNVQYYTEEERQQKNNPQPTQKDIEKVQRDIFNITPNKNTPKTPVVSKPNLLPPQNFRTAQTQIPQNVYAEAYKSKPQENTQKQYADNWMREHLPKPVANLIIGGANKIDETRTTPVGKFADRFGERGLATAVFDPSVVKTSTGNKYADIGADALGTIAGFTLPTGGANTALSVGKMGGQQALSKFAPSITNKAIKAATAGAGAGASLGTMGGIAEEQSPLEIAKRAGKEAALFSVLDAAALAGPVKSALTGGAVFGGQSALAGDSKEDILINALTGAGMGALGGMGNRTTPRQKVEPIQGPKTWQRKAVESLFTKPKFEAKHSNQLDVMPQKEPIIDRIEQQKPQPNTNILPNEIKPTTEQINAPKPTLTEKIDNAITYFDQVEANARKRIDSRKSRLNSFPVEDLGDYAVIGASKMAKGGLEFARWSTEMTNEFGEEIKPHLEEIYTHAKNIYNNHTTNTLPDTSKVITSKTNKGPFNISQKANSAYINLVDDLHRLNQFDKYIERHTGEKLTSKESTYLQGLNSRSSDIISKQIMTDRLVDPKGNVIGNGLSNITKQIPKGLETKFEDYLINKHAPSWMEQGRKVFPDEMGMTPEFSAQKVAQYEAEHPQFKQIAEEYNGFMNNIVQKWAVDTGLISQESFDAMRNMYPNYVPLQREFKDIEKPSFRGAKKSFANQNAPVKKATGSQRPIISPIESTIEMIDKLVKTAKRNEVMQTLVKQLEIDPKGLEGFATIVKDKEDILGDINKTLKEDGIDGVIEKYNQQFDEIYSRNKNLNRGNIVTGLVNGKKVHVEVNDPQLLDALTSLSDRGRNVIINSIGQVTRVMKNLTTGINPVFSVARNIFRDIPTSYINSKTTSNPVKFASDMVGSFVSVLSEGISDTKTAQKVLPNFVNSWLKNQGELFKSYKEIGGGHSSSISSGRNTLAESKASILNLDVKKNPIKAVKATAGKGISALERFNNAIETAPRLAEFKRLAKNGDKQQGLYEANDVTVNFKRRGKIAKDIDTIIPYFNAAIQGIDKLVRTYKDNPVKAVTKSFLAVTIPTIYLYSVNHDNPDYQKLNNYTKDNNFLFPNSDGTFTKIPKPREVGVVFGSLVERSLRQWQDNDPEAFREFTETVKANFSPPLRTILHPILRDLPSNKDFVDRPIVPKSLEKLSPRYQYDEKTSEVSKKIGDILNISPKKIDYTAKSYLGVLAQLGIPATSKGATIKDTLKQQVTVDPLYSNDIINRFYENKDALDTEYSDYKATGEMGGKSKAQFDKDMELRKTLNRVSLDFSDTRKLIKQVEKDTKLSESQKKEKVKRLMLNMQETADKLNKGIK